MQEAARWISEQEAEQEQEPEQEPEAEQEQEPEAAPGLPTKTAAAITRWREAIEAIAPGAEAEPAVEASFE
jgi:hypothetical protein